MATNSEALTIAFQHRQAGRLQAAEEICQRILQVEPDHADTLHLLGAIAAQMGRPETAIEHIRRAMSLNSNEAALHNSLGIVFKGQGRQDEAVTCYRRALELRPDFAVAHNNLGNAFKDQGKLDEAVACYRRALELRPDIAGVHNNLGRVLKGQGKLGEAVACYRRALRVKPDYIEAHYNLGFALQDQGNLDEAVTCYRRTLELKPNYAEAHNNLGNVFRDQGNLDGAVACYHRALALKPDYVEARYNLGLALQEQGNLDEAVAWYRRALELKPDLVEAHNNLGNALRNQGNLDEAVATFRRALALNPDYAEVHYNLGAAFIEQNNLDEAAACCRRALDLSPDYADGHTGLALLQLLRGDFLHGWPEYEWRRRTKQLQPRPFAQLLWDGSSPAGKTILLYAEQGLGDTLQFARYAPLVKSLGATVIVECEPLRPLLASCAGVDRLVAHGDELPAFDTHAPLLSLPGILRTALDSVPAAVPYLAAMPALVEAWGEKLRDLRGFKIGINWQGRPGAGSWRARNVPLRQFAALGAMEGVRLVSLQKGPGRGELAEVREHFPVFDPGEDVDQAAGAFMDSAAIMMHLDLVITSDTAVPHLAGELGVPVWVALPFAPDWRWMLDRPDSPWYPTMRLFRQRERGDWQGVFAEIEAALRRQLELSCS